MEKGSRKLKYSLLHNIFYAFQNIWKWDKNLVITSTVCIPLSIFMSILTIWTPKKIIESFETYTTLHQIILTVVTVLIVGYLAEFINIFIESKKYIAEFKMTNHYETEVYKRLLKIDYEYIEDPITQDMIKKAISAVDSNTTAAMRLPEIFSSFVINVLSFFLFGGILSYLNPLIVVFLICTACINLFLLKWLRNYKHSMKDKNAKITRKLSYLLGLSSDLGTGKDIRLYSMAAWLREFTKLFISESNDLHGKYRARQFVASMINLLIIFIRDGGAYIYLIMQVVHGEITAGDFLLYFGAIGQFSGFILGVTETWSDVQTASLEFNDYRTFEELKNKANHGEGVKLPSGGALSIDINHVSYKYPGCSEPTINDIDLHIKPGEKIAVVGLNGAGKTTLIKLICGMYTPTEGTIKVNGYDMNEYNREDYYSLIAAVFQFFSFLPLTIAENVAPTGEEIDYSRVNECLELSGLSEKIAQLLLGIHTPLIKNINPDGTELSGGEAQKLMLARALYKDAPILILDEPTAALDPVAESNLYQKYNSLTKDKTSIFISHRLASTHFCDRVVLLENGKIVETGTHDELLKLQGKYAELFNVQSQYYQECHEEVN